MTDTIFAPATAAGRAAVAVVRVSGPRAAEALVALAGETPSARMATVKTLRWRGEVVDHALVLWFPAPASYTGEDCAELQLHGGSAIVDGVSRALADMGLRLAEPGEFTRRAFENGKLDLAQAEAVADLIDAETAVQARQAISQLEGALGDRHEAWRGRLVEALALLEAAIDFPDEELPEHVAQGAAEPLRALQADLDTAIVDVDRGQRVREGFRVALIGAPNAGKSTLLNALAGRDAAIVTDTPGTTRDVIEIPIVLGGYKLLLADTAGVRQTRDPIEAEGVRRALAWAETADLRVWVVDSSGDEGDWEEASGIARATDLCVLSKIDMSPGEDRDATLEHAERVGIPFLLADLQAGQDAGLVAEALEQIVVERLGGADFPAATRLRHETHLRDAASHVARALAELADGQQAELAAEDVRLAARALARIAGRVDAEQILDQVFSTFCIGK